MKEPESILHFWFGTEPDDARAAEQQAALWWSKNPEVDAEIRRRFGPLLLRAESGDLRAWAETLEGRLALIILTDQFPRNIFRGTPAAFRFDGIARDYCLQGLTTREELRLRPIQRVFFYLPLEHSENLEHQKQCVRYFEELAGAVPDELKPPFDAYLDYALRHHAIIERFGRFPHRNSILGRESTPEEIEFLGQPGSSF